MNILMIGNGFDLEHGLPTKYPDFLDFVDKFRIAYQNVNSTLHGLNYIEDEYLKNIFKNKEFNDRVNALHVFIKDNLWIKYFQSVYKEHLVNKEGWIDFESEISSVIQAMDGLIKYYESVDTRESKNKNLENFYRKRLTRMIDTYELTPESIRLKISRLLYDLNKLISALEIYIWDYVGSRQLKYYSPDIEKIHPDKVFSFNYSNTYRNLYAYYRKGIDYSFAHGKATNNIYFFGGKAEISDKEIEACIQKNAENNNMVLGIDEYLPEERRSKEVDFIAFKKYYQRIYKRTGNEYKKWLKQIDENVKLGREEENTLYIFGHSLDVTDGDVLREFINHENLKTVIFYRNNEQLGQQIANLVKILKSDVVIKKVYGSNPTITFKMQSKREVIAGSAFEIKSDTMQFENIYSLNNLEAEELIRKIKNKIEQEDLSYFYSQEAVITLFDVMQKKGLAHLYSKKLLDIAYKLLKCEGLQEPKQFDTECWGYQDYDNSFGCDQITCKFVESINLYNRKHFSIGKPMIKSFDEQLINYEQIIKSKRKINKEKYYAIIDNIFCMFTDKERDIEKLWNILLRISRGPGEEVAKDVLMELIKASKNELNIIRYNHLLSEIQMNKYWDMRAEEFGGIYRDE